ncbi:MAG: hypothetical protein Q7U47_09945 [Paludibacter sp.]|nr:hypothetical protein [Paludibacter sp.]
MSNLSYFLKHHPKITFASIVAQVMQQFKNIKQIQFLKISEIEYRENLTQLFNCETSCFANIKEGLPTIEELTEELKNAVKD